MKRTFEIVDTGMSLLVSEDETVLSGALAPLRSFSPASQPGSNQIEFHIRALPGGPPWETSPSRHGKR